MSVVTRMSSVRWVVAVSFLALNLASCADSFHQSADPATPDQERQAPDNPSPGEPPSHPPVPPPFEPPVLPPVTPPPVETSSAGANYFRIMVNKDPSTTAVIGFNATTANVADHRVHYDTVDHGRDAAAYARSMQPSVIVPFLELNNAYARLENLRPDTKYYFVVSDPDGVSRRFWFKTAPASSGRKLSFIVGGDSRNNRDPRKQANLLVSKLRANAVMFGGDMTGGGTAKEWREWFEDWQLTISSDGRVTPLIITQGNHEKAGFVEKLFDAPKDVYYAVTYGGNLVRIYTLNTELPSYGTQTQWLSGDMSQNMGVTWKFAQYHKPMRPHSHDKGEGTKQYDNWAPLFDKYDMDVVSECDAHVVKSTWPIRPTTAAGNSAKFIRDDRQGTVYIGEGGWGAPLRANDWNRAWTRNSGKFNHFNLVFVDRDKVEIRTVKVDAEASSVDSVSDSDPFKLPAKLKTWAPSNGAVISLKASRRLALTGEAAP